MKRLITCAALVMVTAVGIGSTVIRMSLQVVAADGESRTKSVSNGEAGFRRVIPELDAVRQQLLERLKAKVELMSDEEIKAALQSTDAEIRVMKAKQKLDQTAETLRSIVSEFEGTPSAAVAREMLVPHERGPVPTY